jgi:hypothetical protein
MRDGSRGVFIDRSRANPRFSDPKLVLDSHQVSLPRFPASPLPRYVLTFASSTNPPNRNTKFGTHAARTGLITPPAPMALVI